MGKFQDLTDQTFGLWKVLSYSGDRKWLCECQCKDKTQKIVSGYSLKKGTSKSCGCERKLINSAGKLDDLTGQTFGEWEVLEYVGESYWKCRCSCNEIRDVKAQSLKSGKSTSCGHSTTAFKDLTNMTFGDWEVLEYSGNQKWKCRCMVCDEIRDIESFNLTHGKSTSCGKHKISSKLIDITGQTFGELTVKGYLGGNKWLCECSCGNKAIKYSHNLRRSESISCGCKDTTYTKEEILKIIGEFIHENGELPFRDDLIILLDRSQTTIERYITKYDLYEYINKSHRSRQERELADLFHTDYTNNRKVLSSYEIDLYYPDNKIGLEFNGSYWHSEIYKDKTYHQAKSIEALKNNIRLFHIFEYEWDNEVSKNKIIKLLNRKIGKGNTIRRIYARETNITEIDNSDAKEFLETYHLQGGVNAPINIGIFSKDELVGVMTFGTPRFNANYQYELIRMCWKNDVVVVGGASKAFKYFIETHRPNSVISYTDFSKFDGKVYKEMGFEFKELTQPNYVWWNTRDNIKLSRYETMKHKLLEKGLGKAEETEDEIMYRLGYVKIYDCGNLVYIWSK